MPGWVRAQVDVRPERVFAFIGAAFFVEKQHRVKLESWRRNTPQMAKHTHLVVLLEHVTPERRLDGDARVREAAGPRLLCPIERHLMDG